MKDEIKEIREYISCPQFGDDHYGKWGALRLDQRKKIKDLLDYITNLQEQLHQASLDIQELTEKDIGCPSWCDKLTNLQEENEKAKKLKNYYREKFISNFCANNRAIKCIKDFLCTEEYIKSDPEATANNYVGLLNILESETQENLYRYTPKKGFRLVGDEDE